VWIDPELHRLYALLWQLDPAADSDTAFEHLQTAHDLAEKQHSHFQQIRAATGLARMRAQQGRRDEAWRSLVHVHEWFGEESDSPDLADAKALLDDLRN
jgi:hypothetical protein